MKNIVIIGAGDLGKEIVWLIEDINKVAPTYLILGFLDDDVGKHGEEFYGYKVLGKVDRLEELSVKRDISAVIAIQDGQTRREIVTNHPSFSRWETIIHPSAVVASSSTIGFGSVLFPQVTVSVDSRLGAFGLFYTHATVCNDCVLGDYVSVMCGASILEHARIGAECFLAAGACVYPHKMIGKRVKAAIEATLTNNHEDGEEVEEK